MRYAITQDNTAMNDRKTIPIRFRMIPRRAIVVFPIPQLAEVFRGRILLVHAVFISAPAKITAKRGASRGDDEVCDYARQHCDERQKNNSYSLQDDPTSGHCCLSNPS